MNIGYFKKKFSTLKLKVKAITYLEKTAIVETKICFLKLLRKVTVFFNGYNGGNKPKTPLKIDVKFAFIMKNLLGTIKTSILQVFRGILLNFEKVSTFS